METFASDAALANHAAAPYVAGLQDKLSALVAKPSDVRVYRPVAVEARDGRTTDPRWARVDDYLEDLFTPPDAALTGDARLHRCGRVCRRSRCRRRKANCCT